MPRLTPSIRLALTAILSTSLLACPTDDPPPEAYVVTVTVDHVGERHDVLAAGAFPDGLTPSPIGAGLSYTFTFLAAPRVPGSTGAPRLSFATMLLPSNDVFLAPPPSGIPLFDAAGVPRQGDVTAQVFAWDAGTERDEPLGGPAGTSPNQRPHQAAGTSNVGPADLNTTVRPARQTYPDLPAVDELIGVTLAAEPHDGAVVRFTVTVENRSRPGLIDPDGPYFGAAPLSPGVFAVHVGGAAAPILFTPGSPAPHGGLQTLAEDGNPGPLAATLRARVGVTSGLSRGVWAVSQAGAPVFAEAGLPDREEGLQALAEDGAPASLARVLSARDGVASGVISPLTSLWPGDTASFSMRAVPGEHLSLVMKAIPSNDLVWLAEQVPLFDAAGAPRSGDVTASVSLLDAGTELNQPPGLGADQAFLQGTSGAGDPDPNPWVRAPDDGFHYPSAADVLRVRLSARPVTSVQDDTRIPDTVAVADTARADTLADTTAVPDVAPDSGDTAPPASPLPTAVIALADREGSADDRLETLTAGLTVRLRTHTVATDIQSARHLAADGTDAWLTVDTGDGTASGGVLFFDGLGTATAEGPLGSGTARLAGAATGLVAPGELAVTASHLWVADAGDDTQAPSVRAFARPVGGDAAPTMILTAFPGDEAVRDLAVDAAGRLAAVTSRAVLVWEDALAGGPPDRMISPTYEGAPAVGLQGVAVRGGRLFLTQAATGGGALLVVDGWRTASGDIEATQRLTADLTRPGDVAVRQRAIYVADRGADTLRVFNEDIVTGTVRPLRQAPVTDIASLGLGDGASVLVLQNPPGLARDAVARYADTLVNGVVLRARFTDLGAVAALRGVAVAPGSGALWVAMSLPSAPGGSATSQGALGVIDATAAGGPVDPLAAAIVGAATGLRFPRGLAVDAGRVAVADEDAGAILIFGSDDRDDVAPRSVLSVGGAPWAVALGHDVVYGARADGAVVAFDATQGDRSAPDRVLWLTHPGGAEPSSGVRAIAYDAGRDTLIAADPGAGAVLVLTAASAAEGTVDATAVVQGPATGLVAPVAVATAGGLIFAADHAADHVVRWDGLIGLRGSHNVAPDRAITLIGAASVGLVLP